MRKLFSLFLILIVTPYIISQSESIQEDSIKYFTDPIIVTATKSENKLSNATIPVTVVTGSQIYKQSGVKLADVLSEQTGLLINYFLGAGVQMQGLDADYTLILINGEPVTGRQGGAIDLTRFSVGNISRIEIVKGPSSSLYGSDALAGVINIITKDANDKLKLTLNAKYGTFDNTELNTSAEVKKNKLGFYFFADRSSSSGYDLTPLSESKTAPEYHSYTVTPKITYELSSSVKLILDSRFFTESQKNIFTITNSKSEELLLDDKFRIYDWNIGGRVKVKKKNYELNGSLYTSNYYNNETSTFRQDGLVFEDRTFEQTYNKAEIQLNTGLFRNNSQAFGGGAIYEQVKADYIEDGRQSANIYFGYLQDEWKVLRALTLIAGGRFDSHSDYNSRFSPKLSAMIKPVKWATIRSSAGSGYKAPNFQQLYLNFTNPQVGYSVYGTANFKDGFDELLRTGQIAEILINPSSVKDIEPEISYAYNAGIEITPFKWLNVNTNFFRNDIDNLIDVMQVAKKTNGQSVFTYFNLNRIYTQGFESELKIMPFDFLYFSAGYQYLNTADKDKLEQIRQGKILKVGATGVIRPVQEVEYGGLFGRPKHSGVFKLEYDNHRSGTTINLRTIVKDKYGYSDLNSNGVLDNSNEYAPGYAVWNITVTQNVLKYLNVQAGMENIFDKTDTRRLPELPGRIFYAGIKLNY